METIFLNAAGVTLFVRDDMESGHWVQEQKNLSAEFPYDPAKVIQIGQWIAFRDPATDILQVFEVRTVANHEPDHYQQITAEHLCIAELSDEHLDKVEITDYTASSALSEVLTGTLWSVGNVSFGSAEEIQEVQNAINDLALNGNVDLTNRPIISPETMHEAGYTDFDGDYATLYSMTYVEEMQNGQTCTILMTPIKVNGDVLGQDEIDEYVVSLCSSSTISTIKANDNYGLLMHILAGEQVDEMDEIAVESHDLSDEWEQVTEGEISSADISRGSVWDAVCSIEENWNVYITPRITISSAGAITGRYLDIATADGVWRGLRLSVRKNMIDPCVTYDETEIYTALYGYGGSVDVASSGDDDTTEELTFADEVWTATSEHPAKPSGQTYLEWPAKTALYGRNGRPRFGYYQNANIKDAATLLEKTWESLQASCDPTISITGTCVDLYRLGYQDQPIRLHDLAIIEIEETGETFQIEVKCCDVDLIDPTGTRVDIGDYIPNIIYINRDTSDKASGGGGGGGSKGSMTNLEDEDVKTFTEFIKTNNKIGMVVGTKDGDNYIKAAEIALSINESTGETEAKIDAGHIYLNGETSIASFFSQSGGVMTFTASRLSVEEISISGQSISFQNKSATWRSMTVVTDVGVTMPTISRSTAHYFLYSAGSGNTTPSGTQNGRVITSYTAGTVSPTTDTIYYLGGVAPS